VGCEESVAPGTMIAAGWPGGHYGGAQGHTGIYAGVINGQHSMFAQNSPIGSSFNIEPINPEAYSEVRSKVPYDKSPSQCSTPCD